MERFFIGVTPFALIFCCLFSCQKLENLTTKFKMAFNTTVTVPSSLGVNLPIDLFTPPITTDSEAQFESNNTRKDLVQEIFLETMSISVTSPADKELNFLKSLHIYINAEDLPELLLAFHENVPSNAGASLSLQTTGDDFKEYITKETYTLRVKAVTDELISQDIDLGVRSGFLVHARLLK